MIITVISKVWGATKTSWLIKHVSGRPCLRLFYYCNDIFFILCMTLVKQHKNPSPVQFTNISL